MLEDFRGKERVSVWKGVWQEHFLKNISAITRILNVVAGMVLLVYI